MKKILLYIVFLGLLVIGECLCHCGRRNLPGVFYPRKSFRFLDVNEYKLLHDKTSPLTFYWGSKEANVFEYSFIGKILSDKKYNVLYINKMSYEWEGNTGDFLKDGERYELKLKCFAYPYEEGYYECYTGTLFKINHEFFFKNKEIGDEFKFYLTVVYSLDDDIEKTVVLEYEVGVWKGRYWDGRGWGP